MSTMDTKSGLETKPTRRHVSGRNVSLLLVLVLLILTYSIATPRLQPQALTSSSGVVKNTPWGYFDQPQDEICHQYDYKYPQSYIKDNSTVLRILFDKDFRSVSAEKLSKAVQIPTDVFDEDPSVEKDPKYWDDKFTPFYDYLNKTFPLVFTHLQVELVHSHAIVITWNGSHPSSEVKPILLTAHQDVVPIQKSTLSQWTYPPYDGVYDGDKLWGRGSSDCKNLLIGLLESLEELYKSNFKPKRTIILGFGFDEEVGGERGAQHIGQFLTQRYGNDSFYAVIDEGGQSIAYEEDVVLALPGTSEKGSTDVVVGINTPGGHSSVPPLSQHTSIGLMAIFIESLERDRFQPILSPRNPTFHEYQCVAKYSPTLAHKIKKSLLQAETSRRANKIATNWLYNKSLLSRYLISSTQAVDIINGGVKSNALPEYVEAVINHRIAVESSVDDVYRHDLQHAEHLAKRYDLGLVSEGHILRNETVNGKITLRRVSELEPAPSTPTVGKVWELFAGNIRHVYEQLVPSNTTVSNSGVFDVVFGKPVIVAPGIATGNTDTRYYWNLTKNIFRYRPGLFTTVESHAHGVDEYIRFDSHLQIIAFYYEYLQLINEDENF
ncbi:hypothetical protein KGF57_001945 [Candida theae]|uniref:Peptidase M20 dimerisation domain-containing protein n=1 Tax=Candida theae TaxID=1198502 RepID=A0AAD5FZB6_9ASCO|nr:uncharacterized protein KGF57_001945 [Candida theae]KAI5960474.1 hypothetical protein KGF57_001945 [Candida theae]